MAFGFFVWEEHRLFKKDKRSPKRNSAVDDIRTIAISERPFGSLGVHDDFFRFNASKPLFDLLVRLSSFFFVAGVMLGCDDKNLRRSRKRNLFIKKIDSFLAMEDADSFMILCRVLRFICSASILLNTKFLW